MSIQYKTAKGTQDFGPSRQSLREKLTIIFTNQAQLTGAQPISTPIIEREEVLMEKYGEESDKEIFRLVSEGEDTERTALRYDLTVSFARYVKSKSLKKLKRYTAGPVFRRDQPNMGDGRYRQFLQADYDWLGDGDLPLMDAETLVVLINTLKIYGLPNFIIKINTRGILYRMLEWVGVPTDLYIDVSRVVDKLDKKRWKLLVPELQQILNDYNGEFQDNRKTCDIVSDLGWVIKKLQTDDWEGLPFVESEYLNNILRYLGLLSVNKLELLDLIKIDPTLARGLDYYTGIIFEVVLVGKKYKKTGSIAAGGRYDNLCDVPCVGFSIGIDRLLTVLKPNKNYNPTVWLIQINKDIDIEVMNQLFEYRLELLTKLRSYQITCDTEPRADTGFGPQLKYALKKNIPFVVFVGVNEMGNGTVTIKDMERRKQYDNISLGEAFYWITGE